jgi:type IV secretion system protein VirB5
MNAKREWFEANGSIIAAAAHWRIVAVLALILGLLAAAGNIVQLNQQKVVPYVVAVDTLGNSLAVSRADMATPTPTRVIQAELANLIISWRTVTADLDVQSRMVDRLSSFARGSAKGVLTEWFAANNPVVRAKKGQLVSVNVKSVPLPVSQNSWRIEWTETLRNHVGVALDTARYEATMTVDIQPPITDEEILRNPGGVYVVELSFGKILSKTEKNDEEVTQ